MFWKQMLLKIDNFFASDFYGKNTKRLNYTMIFTTMLMATYLLSIPYLTNRLDYKLGDIANEDVRVPFDIQYVLPSETENLKKQAGAEVKYVFERDYLVFKEIVEILQVEFQVILRSFSYGDEDFLDVVKGFSFLRNRDLYPITMLRKALSKDMRGQLENSAVRFATYLYDNYGITDKPFKDVRGLAKVGATAVTINTTSQPEIFWEYDHILFHKDLMHPANIKRFELLAQKILDKSLNEEASSFVVKRVLNAFSEHPSVRYNEIETQNRKNIAVASVKPITATLKKGLTILRQGDPIDKDKLRKIEIYNSVQEKSNFKYWVGSFLIQMLLLLVISFYIDRFTEIEWDDFQSHFILHSILFLGMILAFVLSRVDLIRNSELYFSLYMPAGFLAILTGVFFGQRTSVGLTIYFSFFIYFLTGQDAASLVFTFIVMMSSIYIVDRIGSRSSFVRGALFNSLSAAVVTVAIELWFFEYSSLLHLKVILGITNGFVGMIIAVGILPVYESIFNLPTRFRLMELADFDQPLLRKIAAETPSTYTHSLMMSNLSERAVATIGGDTLLTRVGCMYHDIGKTLNPSFFAENKNLYENSDKLHEDISSVEYASVIIQHVVDGVRMAKEARLPKKVVAFIPEHHGTTLIRYFYHKALENRKAEKLEKKDLDSIKDLFRYPGPKPQSKETAVVMLADSVEAASRTISNPTQENFETMIEKIFQSKMNEQQFDDCPLTMSDLQKVKETFLEVLMSSFHARPKYPTTKKTESLEKAANQKETSAKNKTATVKAKNSSATKKTTISSARASAKTTKIGTKK